MTDEPQIPAFLLKPAPVEPTAEQLAAAMIAYDAEVNNGPATLPVRYEAMRAALRVALNKGEKRE